MFLNPVKPSIVTTSTFFLPPGLVPGGKSGIEGFLGPAPGDIEQTGRITCVAQGNGVDLMLTGRSVTNVTD